LIGFVAGVKCDSENKVLTDADIQKFMEGKQHIRFHMQTSSKNNINVNELFEEITEASVAKLLSVVMPSIQ
jgi:GTPase SAR1 family protein